MRGRNETDAGARSRGTTVVFLGERIVLQCQPGFRTLGLLGSGVHVELTNGEFPAGESAAFVAVQRRELAGHLR